MNILPIRRGRRIHILLGQSQLARVTRRKLTINTLLKSAIRLTSHRRQRFRFLNRRLRNTKRLDGLLLAKFRPLTQARRLRVISSSRP